MRRGSAALLAAAAAVPLVVAAGVILAGVGRGATCATERFGELPSPHVPEPPPDAAYNSFPPTSGPSGEAPLVWEAYDGAVSQFRLVHNLLHGGIAVQYGDDVSGETVARIRAWYERDPDGTVVAPLPRLGDRVVVTAWRNQLRCSAFRQRAFDGFRAQHRFNGPERPPREALRRGRGGEPNPLGLRVALSPVRARATLSFVYAQPARVALEVRRGSPEGPLAARLPGVSLIPGRPVRLDWDVRGSDGRRLPPGTYALVATADGDVTAVTLFEVARLD